MNNRILNNYFFVLFSLIPISIIFGPSISFINILLIDFSFMCLLIYTKEYKFLSNKTVKLILLLCSYLIFNSIVSENFFIGAPRNFGFIRFLILFCAFNYFFYNKNFLKKVLIIWTLTLFILTIDTYIESFRGTNIFGWGARFIDGVEQPHGARVVSFFKDEPIVGGYINAFYLIVVGYFFFLNHKFSTKYRYYILAVSLFFLWAIILTGERSNAIKATFGFLFFYSINSHFKLKEKVISILLAIILIGSLINSSDFLKMRYKGQFINPVVTSYQSYINKENHEKKPINSLYLKLYQSGFNVFKNYPFFGVGNKNYRLETCIEIKKSNYVCNTHPHQIYFEFLAEHGLIGTIILLFILFNLVFSKLTKILQSKNYIQVGCFTFLLSLFLPFLPSGAFFADYNLTIFWLNLSLMYSVSEKTNIFSKN